ncbi:MAG: hypothetical protein HAW66_10900 [Shewanella sp.]|nr:hypothetical protein [Shewanella sp.]
MSELLKRVSLFIFIAASNFISPLYAAQVVRLGTDIQTSHSGINANATDSVQLDKATDFKISKTITIPNGKKKYRLQQYYQNIPVNGYSVTSNTAETKRFLAMNGKVLSRPSSRLFDR